MRHVPRIYSALFPVLLLMTTSNPAPAQRTADWVISGATIHTGDESNPTAEAIAVRGERIVYVGDKKGVKSWVGEETITLEGEGLVIYPGFVDAHAHLQGLGTALEQIRLEGTTSLEETLSRIKEASDKLPETAWVEGRGWDQNDWPLKVFPTAADLDSVVGGRRVMLSRVDGHAVWVSSAALAAAGIDRDTPDPDGGAILRDAQGKPSGILLDNATNLVSQQKPSSTELDIRRRYLLAQAACLEVGLTGMHDMGIDPVELPVLRHLDRSGELRLRVYGALTDSLDRFAEELKQGPVIAGDGRRLTVRAVKLYADGALGSRGAALLEEYRDDPGNLGILVTPPDSLRARAQRAARAGFQVCIHAIGDRGNRIAIETLIPIVEYASHLEQDLKGSDPRPRIEHVQILHVEDIPRLAEHGIIASMQPTHCTSDMPWAPERLGEERVLGAYVWQDLLQSGAVLALGSDFPVESHDPRLGLYASVTRQTLEGEPQDGWSAQQRLTMEEAIAGFTSGAAYASFQEGDLGVISIGRIADLTILSQELSDKEPLKILEAKVLATFVGGKPEYTKNPDYWKSIRMATQDK